MSDLREQVIRLAYQRPDLRKYLVPLIKQASDPVAQYREILLDLGVESRDLDAYLPLNMSFSNLNDHLREESFFHQFDGRPMKWSDLNLLSFEEVDEDASEGTLTWTASVLLPWESVVRLMLYNTAGDKYFGLISKLAKNKNFKKVISENVDIDYEGWEDSYFAEYLVDQDHLDSARDIEHVVVERRGKFDSRGLQINFEGKSFVA